MICIGKTKCTSEKGLFLLAFQKKGTHAGHDHKALMMNLQILLLLI